MFWLFQIKHTFTNGKTLPTFAIQATDRDKRRFCQQQSDLCLVLDALNYPPGNWQLPTFQPLFASDCVKGLDRTCVATFDHVPFKLDARVFDAKHRTGEGNKGVPYYALQLRARAGLVL